MVFKKLTKKVIKYVNLVGEHNKIFKKKIKLAFGHFFSIFKRMPIFNSHF